MRRDALRGRLSKMAAVLTAVLSILPLCGTVGALTAPEQARVQRLMAREGIGEDYARLRIAAQKPDAAGSA